MGIADMLIGGFDAGTRLRQNREAEQKQKGIAGLYQQAYNAPVDQQRTLVTQAMGLDPQAGMALNQGLSADNESRAHRLVGMAEALTQTPEEMRPQMYAKMLPELRQFGLPVSDQYDPSIMDAAKQILAAAYGGEAAEQYTLSPGAARYDANGNLIAERPFAPVKPSYQWTDQGLVAVTGTGAQPVEYGQGGDQQPAQMGGDQFAFLSQLGAQVTSGQRSPEHNARVGGVPNSFHLTGQARDIAPPRDPQQAAMIRQQAAANGLEVIDEGDHWHLEPRPGQQSSGRSVMPAPSASESKPSALQERLMIARQMGATDDELRQIAIGREGAAAGAKPLPVAALRIVKEETDAANTATQINSTIDRHLQNIESGKLEFGMVSNLLNQGKLAAGIGDAEARNFQEFKSDLEKLRNDSLRLNNGVQTDGDAQRAWNELVANLNDSGYVKQRLQTIRNLNERAARLRRENVEMVLSNYGRGEDELPQASGGPQPGTVEDGYRFKGGDASDPANWEAL